MSGDGNEYVSEQDVRRHMQGPPSLRRDYADDLEGECSNPLFRRARDLMERRAHIYSPERPGLSIERRDGRGRCVFNRGPVINEGEFIAYYMGCVVTKESDTSHYRLSVGAGLDLFVDGSRSSLRRSKTDNVAKFINSITFWDGTRTGGANVGFFPRYPDWPYLYVKSLRKIEIGEELLADYHWFDTIPQTNICHKNCRHCFPKAKKKK